MAEIKTFICPSCNRPILHEVLGDKNEATTETCGCCGRSWTVTELENGFASGAAGGATLESHPEADMLLAYSDDAESALAYLENYFETYDWEAFNHTSALGVPAVAASKAVIGLRFGIDGKGRRFFVVERTKPL